MILEDWLKFKKAITEAVEIVCESIEIVACFYRDVVEKANERMEHKRNCQRGWIRQPWQQVPRSVAYHRRLRPCARSTIRSHRDRRKGI